MRPSEAVQLLRKHPELAAGFLPSLSSFELAAIERELDAVVTAAEAWCNGWTIFNPSTIVPVSLINIVQFPHLSRAAIVSRVKNSLWIYAIDDLIDGQKLSKAEALEATQECLLVACGAGNTVARSELARSLHALREELATYAHYDRVYPYWSMTLVRTIEGMTYEFWMQQRFKPLRFDDALPPFDEYIYFGQSSIAITYLWITGLVLETDPGVLTELPALYRTAEMCARAIRLANDLSSLEREVGEGGVNSVAVRVRELLAEQPEASLPELVARARLDVESRIQWAQQEALRLASEVRGALEVAARFVRAMDVSVELYSKRDVRAWATAVQHDLGQLSQVDERDQGSSN